MRIKDYIALRRRSGIGKIEIDRLRDYIKSDEYKKLNSMDKMTVFLKAVTSNQMGMSLEELNDNIDLVADIITSIDEPYMVTNMVISFDMPKELVQKLLVELIPRYKEKLKDTSGEYDDFKMMNTVKSIQNVMNNIKLSTKEKFKYVEDNFDMLAEDDILLASVYGHFDVMSLSDVYESKFLRRMNDSDYKRVENMNNRVRNSVKNSAFAKRLVGRVTGRSLGVNFEVDRKQDNELMEKIKTLQKLNVSDYADFINNKTAMETLSIEQIARISLDSGMINKVNLATNNPKKLFLFKEFLMRHNVTEEFPDFLTNIDQYIDLLKNTTLEELQNSKEIARLIDIIVQDGENSCRIDSLSKIKDYTKLHAEKYLSILAGNIEKIDSIEEYSNAKEVPRDAQTQKKEALYQLLFGLNATQVENLVKKYSDDIFKPEMQSDKLTSKEKKTVEIIKDLRRIYEAKDVDGVCKKILEDKTLIEKLKTEDIKINYASLENLMIDLYNNRLNEALYNPQKHIVSREITYEGQPSEYPVRGFLYRLFKGRDKTYDILSSLRGNRGYTDEFFGLRKTLLFPR